LTARHKGGEDEEGEVIRYSVALRKEKILEVEWGRTRSHSVENSFWKIYGPVLRQTIE
jgi:hypothetical protein